MYTAPLADMRFILENLVTFEHSNADLLGAVLDEASKLASSVLAPLNKSGDSEGCRLDKGQVRMPVGFKEAYQHYVQGGWNSLPFDPQYGGQGLPWSIAIAVQEMWQAANTSFSLCPMLNQGAVELLTTHGAEEQKKLYLSKMISGEWTGTMNLTEPQAGSDVGAVRARAVKERSHYRIKGQKIFITYGDHDLTPNVIHMVLARLPDAPAGTKGLSLFLVPKILATGERNDVQVASLEHKIGIHASPTAVMSFGEKQGAIGYLVGPENGGMACMFTMMNNARLSVGSQGVALAERAYQQAREYAKTRVQSKSLSSKKDESVTIIHHPDVRRMLLMMKAQTEAGRALVYTAAAALGTARADVLIPVVKAWCTDMAVEVTSLGIQVHGGMGYIEETGAAQHWRDSRITPIYEGTNGIQANDLVFRKVIKDNGAAVESVLADMHALMKELDGQPGDDLQAIAESLAEGITALEDATAWILKTAKENVESVAACAAVYLRLFGLVTGGWLLAKSALVAQKKLASPTDQTSFYEAKIITARFYAEHILPQTIGLVCAVQSGSRSVMAMDQEQF